MSSSMLSSSVSLGIALFKFLSCFFVECMAGLYEKFVVKIHEPFLLYII